MRIITKGATDQSVVLRFLDKTTFLPTAGLEGDVGGLVLEYVRLGSAAVNISPTQLDTDTSAHQDGGFRSIGRGNYRFDIPDAAVAAGVDCVVVQGTTTDYIVEGEIIQLVGFDLQTAALQTDWVNGGRLDVLLDQAAAGGLASIPDTRDLAPVQHIWQLKRSGTGTLESTNPLYVKQGDTDIRFGWNCNIPSILPAGTVLGAMTTPTSTNADLTLSKLGIDPKIAKGEMDVAADADVGTYWVTCGVSNSTGAGPITIYGKVIVQADPDA